MRFSREGPKCFSEGCILGLHVPDAHTMRRVRGEEPKEVTVLAFKACAVQFLGLDKSLCIESTRLRVFASVQKKAEHGLSFSLVSFMGDAQLPSTVRSGSQELLARRGGSEGEGFEGNLDGHC